MTDYKDAIGEFNNISSVLATTSLEDDPEAGARALALARATGAPPKMVYDDLDGFETDHKANLTAGIVRNNSQIASYLRSHPLADVVSNDDYGNLDNFTRTAQGVMEFYKYVNPFRAFVEGTVEAGKEAMTALPPEEAAATEDHPLARAGLAAIHAPMQLLGLVSAPIGGLEAAARKAGQIAGDETGGEQLARDIGTFFESEMGRMGEHHPTGLHPEVDAAKAEINAKVLEHLNENLTAAQSVLTKERDPVLAEAYFKQHYESASLGISGDRVLELYGDRVPSPDDGLLGWVPGIVDQLEAARLGDDVHIPLAKWMTHVDPALAKELMPDVRVWPGGITEREAAEPFEPKPIVDSPMAQARAASGTEPLFAIGDRKLELKQAPSLAGFEEFHEYQFVNEAGQPVGELTIVPDPKTKSLYVANINGLSGLYANSFGPSLIRDLKKQLKAIYPDYETITGHRVSGAREAAGTWESEVAYPKVKLSVDDEFRGFNFKSAEWLDDFRDLLEEKGFEHFGQDIYARRLNPRSLSPENIEKANIIAGELQRISGGKVDFELVRDIKYAQYPKQAIQGVYLPTYERLLVDLFGPNAVGVSRHESIHWLRKQGFFTAEEWKVLESAAEAEDWLGKHGIDSRYENIGRAAKLEEAIAEEFRTWAEGRGEVTPEVASIFQKLMQLWENIKARFMEKGIDPEKIFEQVFSGEIAQREGMAEGGAPKFSLEDAREQLAHLRATVAGLDKRTFDKITKLIQQRHEEDIAKAMARAERNQRKIQSKEWRERESELRKEIDSNIRQRPDVMADIFIGAGELNGKKIRQVNPILESDLTAEQKAALPSRRYYSKEGIPADAAARLFGFPSGDAMINAVIEYNKDRAGRSSKEYLDAVVAAETDARMQKLYGSLDENIRAEAEDQAFSETNLNLIAEEWQAAAMQAKVQVVDKDVAKAHALETFAKLRLADVDFGRLQAQMLKHYRDATRDLINGDPASAINRLQRRYELGLLAAEAKKLDKEQARFERTANQFKKREVSSVEPEYTNFIHDILQRVGKPVRRSIQDVAKEIEAGESKNLAEFVANKSGMLRELAVWDQLFDSNWRKPVEDMTVEEFRAVADSIKSLVFNGKEERKIYRAGEAADLAEVKAQAIETIDASAKGEIQKPVKSKVGKVLRNFYVSHLQMENILNRWDAFDPKGVWNQYVMRDLIDGANQVDAWRKEYAKKIKDLPTPKNLERTIDNPLFEDVDTGEPLMLTRKNLIGVMLNTGTGTGRRSNLFKLAKGYGLEPDQVMAWVHAHATAEDWKFVRGVWDIFAEVKKKSDTMYRSLSGGVPAEDVPTFPIATPHGEVKGGYYPIIFDKEMEGKSRKLMGKDPLENDGYFRAATPAGYTKSRTGYVAPIALDLDQMPSRLGQMLQDIGLRPAVINASKLFYDHDVRSAVRKHYGVEYRDEMLAYLRGVANAANNVEKSQQALTAASEFIRQNMITTLVGFNPGTVLKHGPTAAVLSMREVGPVNFAKAVASMFRVDEATAETNWQFAMKHSLELQRRDRNWEETLYGATAGLVPGEKFAPWRQKIMQLSSKPVALSDMISAVPTWLAAYEKEMGEGGVHGDAVFAADRAVRRAHGSTASTNRTAIMRTANPWLTSVYNFFSDIMNRQMETIWKSGEILDRVKEGEKKAAMAAAGTMTASLFAYAVWPAVVEHMVSGAAEDEKETWAESAGKAMIRSTASSWVGVRDFVNWMLYGYDPQFGMAGTAMKELGSAVNDLKKDHPFRKDHAGRLIQDGAGMVGAMTGMLPQQVGRTARYLHDVEVGREHPKGPWEWLVGLRYGTTKGHSRSVEDYLKGKVRK